MLCPHCKINLNTINLGKIAQIANKKDYIKKNNDYTDSKRDYTDYTEVDICPSCYGVWLDKDEILKLVEINRNTLKLIDNTDETEQKKEEKLYEGEIECPRCHKIMQKFPYAGSSDIIIDSYRDGCGIWLDKGEILKVADYLTEIEKPLTQEQKAQVKESLQKLQKNKSIWDTLNKRYYSENELMADLDSNPSGKYISIIYAVLQGLVFLLFRKFR